MSKLRELQATLDTDGLDAILVTSPDNVRLLIGTMVPSHPRNRHRRVVCIVGRHRVGLLTVTVEESFARENATGVDDYLSYSEFDESFVGPLVSYFRTVYGEQGRVGAEMDYLSSGDLTALSEEMPGIEWTDAAPTMWRLRRVKTPGDVECLRKAAGIADGAYRAAHAEIRSGMTEQAFAGLLVSNAMAYGADMARMATLASGHRSVHVNAGPTEKTIEPGEIVRVDLIIQVGNFHGDVARTFVVGDPSDEQVSAWKRLVGIRDVMLSSVRPGVSGHELFSLYEEAMSDSGLEPWLKFVGHGVGLSVHETPTVAPGMKDAVQSGDIMCIEPTTKTGGFGYHVEEQFLVEDGGVVPFTDVELNRELLRIGNST